MRKHRKAKITKTWKTRRDNDEWRRTHPKQPKRGKKQDQQRTCRCGSREFNRSQQTFADGSVHNRLDCAKCGKYVAYEAG